MKIENLTFRHYESQEDCFDNAAFQITSGIWLLDGDNGAGKTSLMSLIASDKGDRKHMGELAPDAILTVATERVFLNEHMRIPLNIREVLLYSHIMDMNKREKDTNYVPQYTDKTLGQYSNGQLRMAMIRILSYLEPKLLLIDEYLEDLDEKNMVTAMEMLQHMSEKGCIVMITSHNTYVRSCINHTITIKDKKIYVCE